MSKKTISFVATQELAEWIKLEADQRMTTVSSAAQQLLAEKYQANQDGLDRAPELEDDKDEQLAAGTDKPVWVENLMERHSDKWYRPESDDYDYAIRVPDGGREYRKTSEAVGRRLTKYYEEN